MARRTGLTALRAALGAIGGGLEGYATMQEQQRRRAEMEAERQRAAVKQAQAEATALRGEQREAVRMGMVESSKYNPRGIAGGMDMPGATPRQPVFRQQIGETEFVLPEAEATTKHRSTVASALEKAQAGKRPDLQWSDKFGVFVDRNTGKIVRPEGQLAPVEPRSGAAPAMKPATATEATKEVEGLRFLKRNAKNQDVINAVNMAISDNPSLAQRPGLIGYGLLEEERANEAAKRGSQGRGRTSGGSSLMTGDEETDAQLAQIFGGQPSAAPTAAPAASRATRQPSTPVAATAASPASSQRTAAPSTLVDRETEDQRRLWDQAVQIHGREKVLREYGPRP